VIRSLSGAEIFNHALSDAILAAVPSVDHRLCGQWVRARPTLASAELDEANYTVKYERAQEPTEPLVAVLFGPPRSASPGRPRLKVGPSKLVSLLPPAR